MGILNDILDIFGLGEDDTPKKKSSSASKRTKKAPTKTAQKSEGSKTRRKRNELKDAQRKQKEDAEKAFKEKMAAARKIYDEYQANKYAYKSKKWHDALKDGSLFDEAAKYLKARGVTIHKNDAAWIDKYENARLQEYVEKLRKYKTWGMQFIKCKPFLPFEARSSHAAPLLNKLTTSVKLLNEAKRRGIDLETLIDCSTEDILKKLGIDYSKLDVVDKVILVMSFSETLPRLKGVDLSDFESIQKVPFERIRLDDITLQLKALYDFTEVFDEGYMPIKCKSLSEEDFSKSFKAMAKEKPAGWIKLVAKEENIRNAELVLEQFGIDYRTLKNRECIFVAETLIAAIPQLKEVSLFNSQMVRSIGKIVLQVSSIPQQLRELFDFVQEHERYIPHPPKPYETKKEQERQEKMEGEYHQKLIALGIDEDDIMSLEDLWLDDDIMAEEEQERQKERKKEEREWEEERREEELDDWCKYLDDQKKLEMISADDDDSDFFKDKDN